MRPPRAPRDRQRGNSLLLALIVMSALATLGSLTVVSTQSSLKTSTNNRAQTIAMYAAESGAAVAMEFLRHHFDPNTANTFSDWSAYLTQSNANVGLVPTSDIPSNGVRPGDPSGNNLFSADQNAWYEIQLYNNRNDPKFNDAPGQCDGDGRLIIRSTGHGPQGSVAIIEWEVQRTDYTRGWQGPPLATPPPDPFAPAAAAALVAPPFGAPNFWWFAGAMTQTDGVVLVGYHVVSL